MAHWFFRMVGMFVLFAAFRTVQAETSFSCPDMTRSLRLLATPQHGYLHICLFWFEYVIMLYHVPHLFCLFMNRQRNYFADTLISIIDCSGTGLKIFVSTHKSRLSYHCLPFISR